MPDYTNLLSEDTVKYPPRSEGWTALDNCTIERLWRGSPVPTEVGATVYFNAITVTATASGGMTAETEHVTCTAGAYYKASLWVGQGAVARHFKIGINFYTGASAPIDNVESEYESLDTNTWNLLATAGEAPVGATKMALYITAEGVVADEVFGAAWPCLLNLWSFGSSTLSYVLDNLPDYMLDADDEIDWPVVYPLRQFTNVLTAQMQDTAADVEDWGYTRAVEATDGVEILSALGDPHPELGGAACSCGGTGIAAEALPWLAQLVGTKLDPTGARGLTPWSFVEGLGWTAIEGYTWSELETESPTVVDVEDQYRCQIATAYNGIYHGQTASVKNYLAWFLASRDPDVVVITKHHGDVNIVLITVPETEDTVGLGIPLLTEIAQSLMPIGVSCEVEYA